SKNAASRVFGLRGSSWRGSFTGLGGTVVGAADGAAFSVVVMATSHGSEGDGDVVAAKAEGVVEPGDVAIGERALLAGDIELHRRIEVVEIDRRGHHAVAQRE